MVWSEQLVEHSYSLPEIQESDPLGGNRAEFDATSCELWIADPVVTQAAELTTTTLSNILL